MRTYETTYTFIVASFIIPQFCFYSTDINKAHNYSETVTCRFGVCTNTFLITFKLN